MERHYGGGGLSEDGDRPERGILGNCALGTLGSGTGYDVDVGMEDACGVVAVLGIILLLRLAGNTILAWVTAAYVGFTLGCVAVSGSVGALGWGSSLWNVVAKSWRCCRVSDAIGGRRVSVSVERRAAVRSLAAAMMIWSRVAFGIFKLCGNHLTVSQIRVEAVEGVQML